jgi:hypothetical protein
MRELRRGTTRPFCDNCKIAKLGLEVERRKKEIQP